MLRALGKKLWTPVLLLLAALALLNRAPALAVLGGGGFDAAGIIRTLAAAGALVATVQILLRVLEVGFWRGLVPRRTGVPPPRLLTQLVTWLIWLIALLVFVTRILGQSLPGLLTTSSVGVAILGFAMRSLISDLFSGIAIGLEQSFAIGDWVEVGSLGGVGRVTDMSWRSTGLLMENGVQVTIPNGRLSESVVRNFHRPDRVWRDEIDITLDYAVTGHQVERVLLSAAQAVPELAALPNPPDLRIAAFSDTGVIWRLRYWVPDYPQRGALRHQVQRNILRNLHYAGLKVAAPRLDARIEKASPPPSADGAVHPEFLRRVDLLRGLDEADRVALAEATTAQVWKRGQAVVRQGDAGSSLFLLKEGLLEVAIGTDTSRRVVGHITPGGFFGEMSLLTGAARSADVVASLDSLVFEITHAALQPIMRRREDVVVKMSRALAERQLANAAPDPGQTDPGVAHERLAVQLLGRIRSFFGIGRPPSVP
jgi:small-conductance mechanosensitive channel